MHAEPVSCSGCSQLTDLDLSHVGTYQKYFIHVPLTLELLQSMDRDVYLPRLAPFPVQISEGNEVFSIGASIMRQRKSGMNPALETSTEHHCLTREPWLHLFPLALEEDLTVFLWDTPTATERGLHQQPAMATLSHT